MNRFLALFFFHILFLVFTGCEKANVVLNPKIELTQYTTQSFKVTKPQHLNIINHSGRVDFLKWKESEIKFEMTKRVRGRQEKKILKNELNNLQIKIKAEHETMTLESFYDGKIKNPMDYGLDILIYLPEEISTVKCNMDLGKIRFLDKFKGNLLMKTNLVDIEINDIEGRITISGDMGDVRINQGFMLSESSVKLNNGNILIKAKIEQKGEYTFKTEIGNIDLAFPETSEIHFENVGTMKSNEFTSKGHGVKVRTFSGMGRAVIKKYKNDE